MLAMAENLPVYKPASRSGDADVAQSFKAGACPSPHFCWEPAEVGGQAPGT